MSVTPAQRSISPVENSVELTLNSSACTTTWRGKIWNFAKKIAPITSYNINIYAPLALNIITELGKKSTLKTAIANIPNRAFSLLIEIQNQKYREAALNIAALACLFLPKGRMIAISLDMVRLGLGGGSFLPIARSKEPTLALNIFGGNFEDALTVLDLTEDASKDQNQLELAYANKLANPTSLPKGCTRINVSYARSTIETRHGFKREAV